MVELPTRDNPNPPLSQPEAPRPPQDNDVEENKVLAAISYIWIASLIVLLAKKDSKFAQFHAQQGLVLFLASILFAFIPFLGMLLNLVVLVFVIYGLIGAFQGKWQKIPLVHSLAEKIKL